MQERPASFGDLSETLQQVFDYGGPLAAGKAKYRLRDGQLRMVAGVEAALMATGAKRTVLIEAPCGTGKSLAYLIPSILSGARVLVVTANKALQNQLIDSDLPFLLGPDGGGRGAGALPSHADYALLKGLANYVCPDKLQNNTDELRAENPELLAWAEDTDANGFRNTDLDKYTGLRTEKDTILLAASHEECDKLECKFFDHCGAMRATREIITYPKLRPSPGGHLRPYTPVFRRSLPRVVVTNYASFFARMAFATRTLEEFGVIILDEAHEAADKARDAFGFSLSLSTLTHRIPARLQKRGAGVDAWRAFQAGATGLVALLKKHCRDGLVNIEPCRTVADELRNILSANSEFFLRNGKPLPLYTATLNILTMLASASTSGAFAPLLHETQSEDGANRLKLELRCLFPASILSARLFSIPCSVIVTSATLCPKPQDFSFICEELGVPSGASRLMVESPFDWAAQLRTLVLRIDTQERPDQAANIIGQLAQTSNGRLLGLFKNIKRMREVKNYLLAHDNWPYPVDCTNDGRNLEQLVAQQRKHKGILLGVDSCWTGLDISGDAMSLLYIDKLPFPHAKDPFLTALDNAYQARGRASFNAVNLPRMLLQLRQGIGRLIRSETDKGVVVLACSPDTLFKGYWSQVCDCFPKTATINPNDIASFLAQ